MYYNYGTGVGVGASGRRDSLERAAAAVATVFSPGTLEQYSRGKWPGASTGSNVGNTGAPLSPPLAPVAALQRVVSAAPGAEAAKYRLVSNGGENLSFEQIIFNFIFNLLLL